MRYIGHVPHIATSFNESISARLLAIVIVFLSAFLTLEGQKSPAATLQICSLATDVEVSAEQAWEDASESRFQSIHRSSSERLGWLTELLKIYKQLVAFGTLVLVTLSVLLVIIRERSACHPPRLCDRARHERSGVQLI